ncbi:hypothetical protein LZQ00_08640 [Sphingobacterium sp. SRCM116780]|uniref:hypothetical protein n=1 Tax=Sphingobacterium sp. SRCM116780 TaxID=2907623 RepID=UPI001F17BA14|nr:hypothetical protein [Sphingobacterium sp. SRCM116780]UIR57873.1 hypothetical protein LZQ00_08640 [Sphingobacterium sp. SRCM116780]
MKNYKKVSQKYFLDFFLKEWEKEDGVNFAIALARVSGWLIHVDWWTPYNDAPLELRKSLRVYVGTDNDDIFDFIGKKKIQSFNQNVILPIAAKRGGSFSGGIQTTFYSEEQVWKLPLRVMPSEEKILKAVSIILKSELYLKKLPKRLNPNVPAHLAASFSFGHCAVFAHVLQEKKGLTATAIIAEKYTSQYAFSRLGYCHSVNIHLDGEYEDSFGKQPLDRILARFGVEKYRLDEVTQIEVHATLKRNSPAKYEEIFNLATELITLG